MNRILLSVLIVFTFSKSLLSQTYRHEDVFLETDAGKLGGVLTLPPKGRKMPAVLIIQGSGPTDKDGNSVILPGKNNSLKLLSETLANAGIATLRFDKRGMGMSADASVNEENLSFDDFVNDANLFLNYLIEDKRFKKVGVAGHSQGSLIGMLISQKNEVSAFTSIAGPSFGIDETLLKQIKDNPYNPPKLLEEAKSITASLKEGVKVENVSPFLQSIYRPSVQRFMMSWMKYHPTDEINKLTIPVLVINGTTDLQVSVEDAQRLHISNENAKLCIIEGMTHSLKNASAKPMENSATLTNPELPLNEKFKQEIVNFFKQYLK